MGFAQIFEKAYFDPGFLEKSHVFFIDSKFFYGKAENDVKKMHRLKGVG